MSRFLFVYGELAHGGIQTLIVRLANFLAGQNRSTAVCSAGGELAGQLNGGVDILTWSNRRQAVALASEWLRNGTEPATMISFDPISAALGLAIEVSQRRRGSLVHLSGVYHPRSFFMTGERPDRVLLNRLIAKAVGDPLVFYMNAECRDEHARRWDVPLERSAIIPLPIEQRRAQWRPEVTSELRIVSVGRFTDFKAYNLAAPQIARECRDVGTRLRWDLFGWGPLESEVRGAILEHRVADVVHINGELPYTEFVSTVRNYNLFVGMGTAALEAAMIGIPVIVATESETRKTYGFVDDLPFGNVGERQESPPPYDLGELIRKFAATDASERVAISRRCRNAVLDYSIKHCVEELGRLAAAAMCERPSLTWKRAVSLLYESFTSGPVASLGRRLFGTERRRRRLNAGA